MLGVQVYRIYEKGEYSVKERGNVRCGSVFANKAKVCKSEVETLFLLTSACEYLAS